jgi:hypothetical protein
MPQIPTPSTSSRTLALVKVTHTVVWAFFVACIVAIPIASLLGEHSVAAWLAAAVLVEVVVLALNNMRCPLTAVAARYTGDRRPNFDIFLPEWLAKHNKVVFGGLYVAGVAFALSRWLRIAS